MSRCPITPFSLSLNVSAVAAEVYPQVRRVDTIKFDRRYFLTGVQLSNSIEGNGGVYSGVFVVLGIDSELLAITDDTPVIASHLFLQNGSRNVFVNLHATEIEILAGMPISLYYCFPTNGVPGARQLTSVAALQLALPP